MAHYDTIWTPHTVYVASAHSPKEHYKHDFHFPPMGLHGLYSKFKSHKATTTSSPSQSHGTMDPAAPAPAPAPAAAAAWSPRTDIRETRLAYHIEIEVAGVKDKESLLIQWMSPRTLLVEGELKRPEIGRGMAAQGSTEWEQENETPDWPKMQKQDSEDGGECDRVPSHSKDADAQAYDLPTFLLGERKVGHWQRTFTLPINVDMKALRAKLEDGLLRIDLPKRDLAGEPKMKIVVE